MKTTIIERRVKPHRPVIVEGLPGLGSVGKVAASYLIRQLKAKAIADLYSPHFPYYALVDKQGVARLPRNEFYLWRNSRRNKELVIITGDCQPQTNYGQYEVANKILDYARKHSASLVITVGGYSSSRRVEPKIVGATSDRNLIKRLQAAGVQVDKTGIPIVGIAGLILALAEARGLKAICLLGETVGYMPDPKAAKAVLQVVAKLVGLSLDLKNIEKEIVRMREVEARIKEADKGLEEALRERKVVEKVSYIS